MGRLNRYLLKNAAVNVGALIVMACCVLLLERLLRIFEVVQISSKPASDTSQMVINLLPHYLGIAVPIALLLGIIITVDRFSRSSELTAALGAGISLFHMTKPFVVLAVFLAGATVFLEGYLQPVGRYNYRQVESSIKNQSTSAALREGTFTPVGNRTFFAGTELEGSAIGPIFIYEKLMKEGEPMGLRLTTAGEGQLIVREKTLEPVLQLASGQINQIVENRQLDLDLSFESSAVTGTVGMNNFRKRGDDERELTSLELFKNRNGEVYSSVSQEVNNSALHLRIGRTVLLLILPFIAVPFGLNYGRNPSSAGLFIGVVLLIAVQKALEFAQSLGAAGTIPPWAGIWAIIGGLAIFAAYIFRKSAYKMGQPPLTSIAQFFSDISDDIRNKILALQRLGAEKS